MYDFIKISFQFPTRLVTVYMKVAIELQFELFLIHQESTRRFLSYKFNQVFFKLMSFSFHNLARYETFHAGHLFERKKHGSQLNAILQYSLY